MSGQSHLLRTRRFLPLFITQFLGAFNDNVFKNALVVLLTFHAAQWTTLPAGILANLAAGVFILPFFLFSATAGQLADKYDKARLARLVKVLEVGIMLVAGVGFWLTSLAWLFAALFLLGCHSTLFGPIKYALLPQHLKHDELLGGNALVEAGTFVAILLGTLGGGLLAGAGEPLYIAGAGVLVALAGYLASRAIPEAPAPAPDLVIHPNPLAETWRCLGFARENPAVFQSILGISWFWLFGALFLAQFPAYAKNVLGGGETAVTLLLATFTLGVGIGSLACERLSGRRIELGLVPFGSIGLTLFALDLALASPTGLPTAVPLPLSDLLGQPGTWRILADLGLIGLFGGFFIVPLYALVQQRSRAELRARVIAANNIMNALFMVAGSLVASGLLAAGLTIANLFAVAALMNAAVAVYIYLRVPEFLIRFVVWLVLRVTGRIEATGMDRLPEHDGALLILESEGPLQGRDLMAVLAASERPIRFLLDPERARTPGYGLLLYAAKAIFTDHAAAGRRALQEGQLVAVAHNPIPPEALREGTSVHAFRVVVQPADGYWGKTRVSL
jgi:MFS family permease